MSWLFALKHFDIVGAIYAELLNAVRQACLLASSTASCAAEMLGDMVVGAAVLSSPPSVLSPPSPAWSFAVMGLLVLVDDSASVAVLTIAFVEDAAQCWTADWLSGTAHSSHRQILSLPLDLTFPPFMQDLQGYP